MQSSVSWVRRVWLEARRCPPLANGSCLDHMPEILRAIALSHSSTRFACWHRANAGRSKSPSAPSTVLLFPAPPPRIHTSSERFMSIASAVKGTISLSRSPTPFGGSEKRQQASCCRTMYGPHACRTNLAHVEDAERVAAEPQPAAGSSTSLNTSGSCGINSGCDFRRRSFCCAQNFGEKGSWLQAAIVSPRLAPARPRGRGRPPAVKSLALDPPSASKSCSPPAAAAAAGGGTQWTGISKYGFTFLPKQGRPQEHRPLFDDVLMT